jgi:PST family polysaccharide transporter
MPSEFYSNIQKIAASTEGWKAVKNSLWLVSEKVTVLLVSLFTNVIIARYLGVSDFGSLNFAIAVYALFTPLTYLGLNSIVTRELINRPERHVRLMGSAFLLKLVGGVLLLIILVPFSGLFIIDTDAANIVKILAVSAVFESFSIIGYWLISRSMARSYTLASVGALLISSSLKIVLVYLGGSLLMLAIATASQAFVLSILLWLSYRQNNRYVVSWEPNPKLALELLSQSWPLAIAALFAIVYLKIDQVMLGQMLDTTAVGVYSAASRLSEIWYALPVAFATAVFPLMVANRREDEKKYRDILKKSYGFVFYSSFLVIGPVILLSEWVVEVLFGSEFRRAGSILTIHILACPAMFLGAIQSKALIAEGLQKYGLYRDVTGSVLNISMNLVLIPLYGGIGAAISTVVSYTFIVCVFPFLIRNTRNVGVLMLSGILYPARLIKVSVFNNDRR